MYNIYILNIFDLCLFISISLLLGITIKEKYPILLINDDLNPKKI